MDEGRADDDEAVDLATLTVMTGLVVADHIRDALAAQGIPGVRFSQLYLFAGLAQGPSTVSKIAGRMGFSHQAGSQLAAELERAGMLRRVPNPRDGRSRLVELTDAGHRALEAGIQARDDLLQALNASTTSDERHAADRVVRSILDLAGGAESVRIRELRLPKSV